jgi:hypothetical protein
MLNHEGAHQKCAVQGRDSHGEHIADRQAVPSECHENREWHKRDQKLDDAAREGRVTIGRKDPHPVPPALRGCHGVDFGSGHFGYSVFSVCAFIAA